MRISDWSSDVCSSDLPATTATLPIFLPIAIAVASASGAVFSPRTTSSSFITFAGEKKCIPSTSPGRLVAVDRKSVVEGKSVSVRVDLGCRRIIKKQNNQKTEDLTHNKIINQTE